MLGTLPEIRTRVDPRQCTARPCIAIVLNKDQATYTTRPLDVAMVESSHQS